MHLCHAFQRFAMDVLGSGTGTGFDAPPSFSQPPSVVLVGVDADAIGVPGIALLNEGGMGEVDCMEMGIL